MRNIVFISIIAAAAPQLAAAGDVQATALPLDHFRTIAPQIVVKQDNLLIEGGYCRNARYAARPQTVRIVKIDAAGRETASETARVRGKIMVGCDAAFSNLSAHARLNYASRCLA